MDVGLMAGAEDHGRGFRRIVKMLIWLVIAPTAALLAVGILMLVFWQSRLNVVFGILVVTLVVCLVTGAVLSLIFLRREARLSRLQMDFVSKVSHELRTPLTSIRMFAETLRLTGTEDEEKTMVCLEVLEQEASRLGERIERLLDWGRMESGRRVYERVPCCIGDVVSEAVASVKPIAGDGGHSIISHVPEDLPMLEGDQGALVDALVNLLANACKYSSEPGEILVLCEADQRSVRIRVSDNGIGIPRAEHRNIFQKFYRVDERLSAEVEGSGLGLAIVRHVVQGHGGQVELESEPSLGSTFTMVFPRKEP